MIRAALVGVLLLTLSVGGNTSAAAYPVLPDQDWSPILSGLSGPTLTPGQSGVISFQLGNPLPVEMSSAKIALEIYAFSPSDGGAVQNPPAGSTPSLASGGLTFNATKPLLAPNGTWTGGLPVTAPSTAPTGDYAVRISVRFSVNATAYLLESRGYFSSSAWAAATEYPNGTPTINASRLGVSGVIPETSILVRSPSPPVAIYVLLGVGLGLAALGAYWWTRSDSNSRSGARRRSPPQSAPTAFGSNRRSAGD
jgi:hypothetical protein